MITVRVMRPLAARLSSQRRRTRAAKMERRRLDATARWRRDTTTRGTAGASFLNFWRAVVAVRPTLKSMKASPLAQDRRLFGAIANEIAKRVEADHARLEQPAAPVGIVAAHPDRKADETA
jgi:hypothetical protein